MPPETPLLALEGLTVDFDAGGRVARAVDGVDLAVGRGDAVGLVGESGSGKSVTWLAALGLLPSRARVAGRARLDGEDLVAAPRRRLEAIRGRRIAMIFQDPASSLNPVHRIGRQVEEAIRLHRGADDGAARAEAMRLLDQVGIADPRRRLDDYPHQLSGGMNQRVMIAIALAGRPDLLIADEPTTALDATIQAQILRLLGDLRRATGMAMVLISHDLGVVSENVDRVCVMYAGRVVEEAPADALFAQPRHPYTQGLLAALPSLTGPRQRLAAIPGTVPEPWNLPAGCSFAPRCPAAAAECLRTRTPGLALTPEHAVTCTRVLALRGSVWDRRQVAA
ncbi:MAG: ABC transporter ATP-binding protein [Alphaproteobacteria bacterium]|nr:ABC transporter ATP-binding protein [Alphaproteobacteria bacterium]